MAYTVMLTVYPNEWSWCWGDGVDARPDWGTRKIAKTTEHVIALGISMLNLEKKKFSKDVGDYGKG